MKKKEVVRYGLLSLNQGDTVTVVPEERFFADVLRHCKEPFMREMRRSWSGLDEDAHTLLFDQAIEELWVKSNKEPIPLTCTVSFFLNSIGRNKAHTFYRKQKHEMDGRMSEPFKGAALPVEQDPFLVEAAFSGMVSCLNGCLQLLSEKDRQLVSLFHLKGHSMEELAPMLGYSSVNSVKKAKCLALGKLRKTMVELHPPDAGWPAQAA